MRKEITETETKLAQVHCVSQFICQMHSVKHLSYHVQRAHSKMWVVKNFFPWWKLSQSQWCNPNWELLKSVYFAVSCWFFFLPWYTFYIYTLFHTDFENIMIKESSAFIKSLYYRTILIYIVSNIVIININCVRKAA